MMTMTSRNTNISNDNINPIRKSSFSSNGSNDSKKRNVSFSSMSNNTIIPKKEDDHTTSSPPPPESVWYNQEEIHSNLQESIRTLKDMKSSPYDDIIDPTARNNGNRHHHHHQDAEECSRGLEYVNDKGIVNISRIASQKAVQEVLSEQQRLKEENNGQLPWEQLADIYGRSSAHQQRVAHLAALQDAREVSQQEQPESTNVWNSTSRNNAIVTPPLSPVGTRKRHDRRNVMDGNALQRRRRSSATMLSVDTAHLISDIPMD